MQTNHPESAGLKSQQRFNKKKKRKKLPTFKSLRKKADQAMSEYVRAVTQRAYGICPLCMMKPVQCCFHFVSRKRRILRWDLQNVIGACTTCNYLENYFSDLSRAWYIRRFGVDQYLALVDKAKGDHEYTREELQAIIVSFETKLEELCPTPTSTASASPI